MQNCSLPQVSVVIPAYNACKYIADTLDLALNQTFHSFEPVPKVVVDYRRHVSSLSRGAAPVPERAALVALAKWRGRARLDEEERQAVKRTYLQTQSYLDVKHAVDHFHKGEYSLAGMALRRAYKWRPKCRYRAARSALRLPQGLRAWLYEGGVDVPLWKGV